MNPRSSYTFLALLLLAVPMSAAVTGTVVTPEGVPVEGALVAVVEEAEGEGGEAGDAGEAGARVVTGRRGDFAFPDVAPPVLLLVTHPRFEDAAVQVAAHREEPLRITLRPRQEIYDEIVVSATRGAGGGFQPVSVAATAVAPEEKPAPPSTVMDVIEGVPSVAENGQGGHFQTFSIRGIAGQRVLTMISGARIVTERRAGVSLSFVDPLLLGTVDVVRGPSSSYYGSGALGGVVQLFPRRFDQLHFDLGAETSGDERWAVAGTGGARWSAAAAYRKAGDAETPDGERLFSRFEQFSGVFETRWQTAGGTEWEVVAIPSAGRDIGKPNTELPERVTIYPEENHLIFKVGARRPGAFRFDLWAHPNDLETRVSRQDRPDEIERVVNEAFDFGANAQWELSLPGSLAGRVGLEYFGRQGVKATEDTLDGSGRRLARSVTLDGVEDQAAAYGVRAPRARPGHRPGRHADLLDPAGQRRFRHPERHRLVRLRRRHGAPGRRLRARRQRRHRAALPDPVRALLHRHHGARRGDLEHRPRPGALGLRRPRAALLRRSAVRHRLRLPQRDRRLHRADRRRAGRAHLRQPDLGHHRRVRDRRLRPGDRRASDSAGAASGSTARATPARTWPTFPPTGSRSTRPTTWGTGSLPGSSSTASRRTIPAPARCATPSAEILSASVAYQVRDGFSIRLTGSNLLDETYLPSADDRAVPAPERSIGVGMAWTD